MFSIWLCWEIVLSKWVSFIENNLLLKSGFLFSKPLDRTAEHSSSLRRYKCSAGKKFWTSQRTGIYKQAMEVTNFALSHLKKKQKPTTLRKNRKNRTCLYINGTDEEKSLARRKVLSVLPEHKLHSTLLICIIPVRDFPVWLKTETKKERGGPDHHIKRSLQRYTNTQKLHVSVSP